MKMRPFSFLTIVAALSFTFQNCGENAGSFQSPSANSPLVPNNPIATGSGGSGGSSGSNGMAFSFENWNGVGTEPAPGSTSVGWGCHLFGSFTLDILSPTDNSVLAQFPFYVPAKGQDLTGSYDFAPGTYNIAPEGTYTEPGCHVPCAQISYPPISITVSNSGALTPVDINLFVSACPQ